MDSRLINPFSLLGISSKSSPSELKRAYYNLALMCHPDKGGDGKDMVVVSQAYQYVKGQLDNINETTYETLEDEFQEFCKHQEEITPPTFSSIFEETQDWIDDFNAQFEKQQIGTASDSRNGTASDNMDGNISDSENTFNPFQRNPFQDGYGDLMDVSDINLDSIHNQEDLETMREKDTKENTHQFDKQLIEYKEPECLPNTVTSYPLLPTDITDYSGSSSNKNTHSKTMAMTDYKKAFTPPEDLPEVKPEQDYPNQLLVYEPYDLECLKIDYNPSEFQIM